MNYTVYHLHSDLSILDSATKSEKYIELAKENGMTAIGESNHGNIFNWMNRKEKTEAAGLKYIHAQEFYLTHFLEPKVRDNYHVVLIAKNFEGVKELNKLSSIAHHKDGHFYYNARISLEELKNTSNNILVTTACLANPLCKGYDQPIHDEFLKFLIENEHRCWLEVQYHQIELQKQYNEYLYELHKKYKIPLIVGTDTHASDKEHLLLRKILLQAKNIQYTDEDEFDLSFKTYDEVVELFKNQCILPPSVYLEALEQTNVMASMVEEFKLDMSYKYPKLYDNPEEMFLQKINEGIQRRGINHFPKDKREEYYNRIKYEVDTYKKVGAINYMLLMEKVSSWANNQGIYQGYARGSVAGSVVAYILGITEMDSIKWGLNFERFMSPERISLADIDTDWPSSMRETVIKYVSEIKGIDFSEIITFNTVATKGAIRDIGRSFKMPLSEVDEIAKNYEGNEEEYENKYPELFKYVNLLKGVNVSVGSHPSGFVCSPVSIDENIGYIYTTKSKYPVSQINMKELDKNNYVKLDILGLDNIEIINETCKLVGIERLTPDNVDTEDDAVWDSIEEDGLAIFQMEGDFAHDMLSQALSSLKNNPNIKMNRMSLMSGVNGAIRPSGESFRDNFCKCIVNDNGHDALNEFLEPTMQFLVYQEQIIEFLHKFCGFTLGEADYARRLIGKKLGTEDIIPDVRKRFIKTMHEKYNVPDEDLEKIVEPFLQIILDASSYGFSINHSQSYSFIGYICGYLRYYYPLEFITVLLNINNDNMEKTSQIIKYAEKRNIKIKPIKFRKSTANYSLDKNTNSIYKGIASIKYLNPTVAEELYSLKDNHYEDFIDLLIDLKNTSINSKQTTILISLNFFSEFGKSQKLLDAYELFDKIYLKKTIKKANLPCDEEIIKKYAKETEKTYKNLDSLSLIKELYSSISNKSLSLDKTLETEIEYLGYSQTVIPDLVHNIALIVSTNFNSTPKIKAYHLQTGQEVAYKIYKKLYNKRPYGTHDLIYIRKIYQRHKPMPVKDEDGKIIKWKDTDELEWIIDDYSIVDKVKFNKWIEKTYG